MDVPTTLTTGPAPASSAKPMPWRRHLFDNFRLAYPVVISQLGHISVSVADSMIVGRLGKLPLAGVSLVAASVCTRFAVFEAGKHSARDPKYIVIPQRARANARGSAK